MRSQYRNNTISERSEKARSYKDWESEFGNKLYQQDYNGPTAGLGNRYELTIESIEDAPPSLIKMNRLQGNIGSTENLKLRTEVGEIEMD